MSKKSVISLSLMILSAFIISGCGTSQKKVQSEVTGIKTRVETLESRVEGVESKQADVERMTAEQAQALDELRSVSAPQPGSNISVKPREGHRTGRMKEVQQALKNAGYYDGKVDGVKGKNTKKAIKEFQKTNGLTADGVAGPRTWELLKNHLSAAYSASSPVSGEEAVK
ncbi:MAG: peptidoglycan-binding domain-containing protein [Candidatus Omnitrophota bacterium]